MKNHCTPRLFMVSVAAAAAHSAAAAAVELIPFKWIPEK